MDNEFPHRGWGKGTAQVDHAPSGTATIMEIEYSRFGAFYVHGLIDTPERLEQGAMLCTAQLGGRFVRAVVPKEYTHVTIRKPHNSGGIVRWKIGFRSAGECPELRDVVERPQSDVVLYRGPAATATLEIFKEGYAALTMYSLEGEQHHELRADVGAGPFRGPVKLPAGPVLIQVDCSVRWSLTLT